MKALLRLTFVFCSLLMFAPHVNADFCIVPGVEQAIDKASFIFSGKIIDISRAEVNNRNPYTRNSEFVVKFEVEAGWKGGNSHEVEVLWRTESFGCSYFPVGEIGERYLVYADRSNRLLAGEEGLLEVTIFNRTSRIPTKARATSELDAAMRNRRSVLFSMPEINRFDASADIQVLRWLNECGCVASDFPSCVGSFSMFQTELSKLRSKSNVASCCTCFRRRMKQ